MGHALAQVFAQSGYEVALMDIDRDVLRWAEGQIQRNVELLREEDLTDLTVKDVLNSIYFTTSQREAARKADFILESVTENMKVKREVISKLEYQAPKHTIFATNTSGLSVTEISEATRSPERVVGCHWWNPPYIMPLVEVIQGENTSPETVQATHGFLKTLGKEPIDVKKEVPGFIWNRLQIAVIREALHLLEEGVASVKDIDRAVKKGYALRSLVVGPFETMDLSSLNLFRAVSANLNPNLSNASEPSRLFEEKIKRGELGVAAGRGFYDYAGRSREEVIRERDRQLMALIKYLGLMP